MKLYGEKKVKIPYKYKTTQVITARIWLLLQFLELRHTHTVMNYVYLSILVLFRWLFSLGTMLPCTAMWLPEPVSLLLYAKHFKCSKISVEFHISLLIHPKLERKIESLLNCRCSDAFRGHTEDLATCKLLLLYLQVR